MSWAPKRRIGGSDIGKLIGVSRYGNARDVYMRIVDGLEDEWNPKMERGAMFEPVLRAIGQRHFGLTLEKRDDDYHQHPALPYATAQIDDLASWKGLPVVVDYKTCNRWAQKKWGRDGSDEVPADVHAQVAWEMMNVDRELALLVTGFGEDVDGPEVFDMNAVVTFQVERCPRFEFYLQTVAEEFWEEHVLRRVPPNLKPLGKKKVRRERSSKTRSAHSAKPGAQVV